MSPRPALEQAIKLHLIPTSVRSMQAAPLPADIDLLLRLLARDPTAELLAVAQVNRPIEIIRNAAEFYATEILFSSHADAYRTLAAKKGDSREIIRTHMGLLLRWLHPDYQKSAEYRVHYERVIVAWELLGVPERRAEYDEHIAEATAPREQSKTRPPTRAPYFSTVRRQPYGRQRILYRRRLWRFVAIGALVLGSMWGYIERDQWVEAIDFHWLLRVVSGELTHRLEPAPTNWTISFDLGGMARILVLTVRYVP